MALLTVAFALAASLSVAAEQNNSAPNRQLPIVSGIVKAVTPTAVTVRVDGNAVTFKIDASTSVTVDGTTHQNDLVYRGPYRPRTINDFIKTGDNVRVRYRQVDDALLAVELRLTRK